MRFAVLASGTGTNLGALLTAEANGTLAPAEIVVVGCNRPGAAAITRAAAAGKDVFVLDHRGYGDRQAFDTALVAELARHRVEAVVLAGFMRILSATFVHAFPHRIINTHPALCPAFPGTGAPQQAIDHGVRVSGCTVHFVDVGVDTGPIIAQEAVEVLSDDDAASLHARIQRVEHRLLPAAVTLLAEGRLRVSGRRVRIAEEPFGAE